MFDPAAGGWGILILLSAGRWSRTSQLVMCVMFSDQAREAGAAHVAVDGTLASLRARLNETTLRAAAAEDNAAMWEARTEAAQRCVSEAEAEATRLADAEGALLARIR
jgi:hypothetical protein